MKLINTEEIEKDGNIYIKETYDNGTTVEYLKPSGDPPEPEEPPVTMEEMIESIALNTEYLVVLAELEGGGF